MGRHTSSVVFVAQTRVEPTAEVGVEPDVVVRGASETRDIMSWCCLECAFSPALGVTAGAGVGGWGLGLEGLEVPCHSLVRL